MPPIQPPVTSTRFFILLGLLLSCVFGLSACTAMPPTHDFVISGQAIYRERMLLTPGAELEDQ